MATVVRDYNEQRADGWYHVVQMSDGTFQSTKIDPSGYAAAGISAPPAAPVAVAGGISPEHRKGLKDAGYGDWNNPNLTEADFARISGGAASAAGKAPANPFPGMEFQDPTAIDFIKTMIQQAYNKALLQQGDRTLALDAAYKQAQTGLQALGLIGQFRGPRNAFQYEGVLHGLNTSGVGRSIDALAGRTVLPTFQANQAAPQPVTLQTVRQDMQQAGPSFGASPMSDVVGKILGQIGLGDGAGGTTSGYTTVNGTKTLDQMLNELKGAQWGPAQGATRPSDADIIAQYAHTTGHAVTPPGTGTPPPAMGSAPGTSDFWPSIPGFAGGTNGPLPYDVNAMVGENGPEMAHLPRGSNVVPLFGAVGDTGGAPIRTPAPAVVPPVVYGSDPGAGNTPGGPPIVSAPGHSGGGSGDNGPAIPTAPHTDPGTAPADTWLAQFPTPNDIDVREWNKLDPYTQQTVLSGYEALGYDADSVLNTIKRLSPTWQAPRFGSLVA